MYHHLFNKKTCNHLVINQAKQYKSQIYIIMQTCPCKVDPLKHHFYNFSKIGVYKRTCLTYFPCIKLETVGSL